MHGDSRSARESHGTGETSIVYSEELSSSLRLPDPADELLLSSLQIHSHTCSFYESREQQKQQFVPFLRLGLELGEKCVYFINENDEDFVIKAMQDGGFDLQPRLASGQFQIVHTDNAHLKGGRFSEDKMLAYWNQSIEMASKAGFKGLRAAVEMTWALSGKPGCDALAPYESRLTRLMNEKSASIICMYSRRRFTPEKIKSIIHAHPLVVSDAIVLENPRCPSPDKFEENSVDLDLQVTLDTLELIRDLRQAKRQLQKKIREETSFELLVASVKDYAIFMLDPHGNILSWNEGAERINGYTASEAIGRNFSIFYTLEARMRQHPQKELEIATERGRYEEEGYRVRKDGSMFWSNVVITALRDGNNQLVGFAKVTRDLSERKSAEEARERVLEQVSRVNEELQQLAYVISHELQEPIKGMTSYSGLLRARYRDLLGPDANEFLERICSDAHKTARMVDDLWNYARVSKPGRPCAVTHLGRLLNQVKDELRIVIEESGCRISNPPCEDFPAVKCVREQMQFVIKELITNAIKHFRGAGSPHIEISVTREKNGWTFSFRDNGPGIDKFFAQQIFKVYQRLENRHDENGTGMGLPICKKIIEDQHQGRIDFESAGRGANFFFWLPDVCGR